MKKTRKFNISFICGGVMAAVISLMGHLAFGQPLIDDRARVGDRGEFYLQSNYGTHCHLVLKDNALPVLTKNLSEEEKTHLRDAISNLNTMKSSLKYELYEQRAENVKNYIEVISVEEIFGFSSNTIGLASFNYNYYTAEIKFPITITVESKYADIYGMDENGNTGSAMQNIFEHELLHACGLKDLTDDKYRNNSIMYYDLSGQPVSWQTLDEQNVSQVYKPVPAFESRISNAQYINMFYVDNKNKFKAQTSACKIEDETELIEK